MVQFARCGGEDRTRVDVNEENRKGGGSRGQVTSRLRNRGHGIFTSRPRLFGVATEDEHDKDKDRRSGVEVCRDRHNGDVTRVSKQIAGFTPFCLF